jgi:hypothetical protein
MVLRVTGQVMLGRQDQPALLVAINGRQGTAMATITAPAHFREHQGVAILHDQVDFALPTAEIASHNRQSLLRQPVCSLFFRFATGIFVTAP